MQDVDGDVGVELAEDGEAHVTRAGVGELGGEDAELL